LRSNSGELATKFSRSDPKILSTISYGKIADREIERKSQTKNREEFSEYKTWRRCDFHPQGDPLIFGTLTRPFWEPFLAVAQTT